VAVYSTFFSRAFDQANLDVGLHGLPVVFSLGRAGITGDDGPSHHGILDMALSLKIPGMTIFAPSSAEELRVMLATALQLSGPAVVRYPKTAARHVPADQVGSGLSARLVRRGDGSVCILAVGKLLEAAEHAAQLLAAEGVEATVWDVRVVRPLDPAMVADAGQHNFVVSVEDGIRNGGAGNFIEDAIADLHPSRLSPPVLNLGVPTVHIPHGKPERILRQLGLDGPGIAASIFRAIEHVGEVVAAGGRAAPENQTADGAGRAAVDAIISASAQADLAEVRPSQADGDGPIDGLHSVDGVGVAVPAERTR